MLKQISKLMCALFGHKFEDGLNLLAYPKCNSITDKNDERLIVRTCSRCGHSCLLHNKTNCSVVLVEDDTATLLHDFILAHTTTLRYAINCYDEAHERTNQSDVFETIQAFFAISQKLLNAFLIVYIKRMNLHKKPIDAHNLTMYKLMEQAYDAVDAFGELDNMIESYLDVLKDIGLVMNSANMRNSLSVVDFSNTVVQLKFLKKRLIEEIEAVETVTGGKEPVEQLPKSEISSIDEKTCAML